MKTDLVTSIGIAIVGVVAAYFVCNIFIGDIEPVKVKSVDASVSATLAEPDAEVFNYRALNPTVEVYVGECTEYSDSGKCLDGTIIEDNYDDQDFDIELETEPPTTNGGTTTNNATIEEPSDDIDAASTTEGN